MNEVSIINYDIGNILSVYRAFEKIGAHPQFISTPEEVLSSKRLVLPGVGSFHKGMEELHKRGLTDAIRAYCKYDRPFLGICLGMQLMFDTSEEFGNHNGLAIISGHVKKIKNIDINGNYQKVPHVGWNKLQFSFEDKIFKGLRRAEEVYFVHSYAVDVLNENNLIAHTNYGGHSITALVKTGENVYGAQFHPEKSGKVGLKIIENFSKM